MDALVRPFHQAGFTTEKLSADMAFAVQRNLFHLISKVEGISIEVDDYLQSRHTQVRADRGGYPWEKFFVSRDLRQVVSLAQGIAPILYGNVFVIDSHPGLATYMALSSHNSLRISDLGPGADCFIVDMSFNWFVCIDHEGYGPWAWTNPRIEKNFGMSYT